MNKIADIDDMMSRFRLASREVFNHNFRASDPYGDEGWALAERFSVLQAVLFQKLVTEPACLPNVSYGDLQTEILVELRSGIELAPAFLNREVMSGYWDYPVKEITRGSRLFFLSFFDWNQLDYRDGQYVRIQIDHLPLHPETTGKHALVEWRHVCFVRA